MGAWGLAAGMAGGLAGMGGIQNEKETMQSLNNCLASYLDRVRSLETENQKVKYETELAMRQSVESSICGLHKFTDDTNVTRLQLETEIKAVKEELLLTKKNHIEEVKGLQAQIASSGLSVELARKNQEELDKYWSQHIEENTTVVTTQSAEVGAAEMTLTELRHTVQSLEIDLESMRNMKASLEHSLREVEACYALQMEQLNRILLHLEDSAKPRSTNIKVKLEGEIATYRRLLEDGEDFNLGDALDSSNSMQTIQKTTTHWRVDGKVVSETNDTKVLRH
ncbi:Keratin, type I cytoskeletal 18 [Saguinus oedipus]|uniref:Keratin, type I cytoskeletal 18 n=1 Tax=Saguinus oedipus TaxID=9490 RepID=A0ABQ9W434_SAGOE|nr:Keratin, type I cytoskeletal 18 [Saguinus oedipus]